MKKLHYTVDGVKNLQTPLCASEDGHPSPWPAKTSFVLCGLHCSSFALPRRFDFERFEPRQGRKVRVYRRFIDVVASQRSREY